jgi:hypothetical protein
MPNLSGNALLEFGGTVSIQTISGNGTLSISGSQAFVAASGVSTTSNSALTGLSNNFGAFGLTGSSLTTTPNFNNFGQLDVGATYGSPSATLNIGGTLTNEGTVSISTFADTNTAAITATGLTPTPMVLTIRRAPSVC